MKATLGFKMGAGFGSLIVIICLLGGIAILQMKGLEALSEQIDAEFVPEVKLANELQSNTLEAMLAFRTYGLTAEENVLKEGQKYLTIAKQNLAEAKMLADKSLHLTKLKGQVESAGLAVNEYAQQIEQTVTLNDEMAQIRRELDAAAKDFTLNCEQYHTSQEKKLLAELAEGAPADKLVDRANKISSMVNVIELANSVMLANWKSQAMRDPAVAAAAMQAFEEIIAKLQELKSISNQQVNIDQLTKTMAAATAYKRLMNDLTQNFMARSELANKRAVTANTAVSAAKAIARDGIESTDVIATETDTSLARAVAILVFGLAGALGLGVVIAILLTRGITRPVKRVVYMLGELGRGHLNDRMRLTSDDEIGQMANTLDCFADTLQNETVKAMTMLADGDLTFVANPKDDQDEIGNALKKAGDDLNVMVAEIGNATEQIAAGAGQVSDASQALSQGATEAAAAMEEITSSMTELASQTATNAENANQANQLSKQARSDAEKGNRHMEELVTAMGDINAAGQNISKIIKTIDEIAFQTNLLALNAAVEAARAGRHGKGFAVVAEEVRNLAARSAKAARETAELIEGSVAKAQNGSAIADRTAKALHEIVVGATKVTDLVGEIAAASNEQANGIAQINQGLSQIDQVTQQNTASAEEGAAASEELSSQAVQLKSMLARFKVRQSSGAASASPWASSGPRQHQALPYQGSSEEARQAKGSGSKRGLKPSDIIALDDSEFGKF